MKKSIVLTVLILITIQFGGLSQSKDTVCMPRADAIRKLAQIERLKVDSIELQLRKADIVDLKNVVGSQISTIANLRSLVSAEQMKSSNLYSQISVLHKEVRRQKRSKVFAIIGGVLTSSAILYLTKF